jgi:hypothetical protein
MGLPSGRYLSDMRYELTVMYFGSSEGLHRISWGLTWDSRGWFLELNWVVDRLGNRMGQSLLSQSKPSLEGEGTSLYSSGILRRNYSLAKN